MDLPTCVLGDFRRPPGTLPASAAVTLIILKKGFPWMIERCVVDRPALIGDHLRLLDVLRPVKYLRFTGGVIQVIAGKYAHIDIPESNCSPFAAALASVPQRKIIRSILRALRAGDGVCIRGWLRGSSHD